jgi:hypothetical protein
LALDERWWCMCVALAQPLAGSASGARQRPPAGRQQTASGQWCASFDAAVGALRTAFADGLSGPDAAG